MSDTRAVASMILSSETREEGAGSRVRQGRDLDRDDSKAKGGKWPDWGMSWKSNKPDLLVNLMMRGEVKRRIKNYSRIVACTTGQMRYPPTVWGNGKRLETTGQQWEGHWKEPRRPGREGGETLNTTARSLDIHNWRHFL